MNIFKVAAASLAAATALAGAAFANVVTIGTPGIASVTCNDGAANQCQGFTLGGGSLTSPGTGPTGAGTLSNTAAHLYDGTPSSPAAEVARLNLLAGTSFAAGVQVPGSSGSDLNPDDTIVTSALYILLKIGNDDVFIKNISGGALTIKYNSFPGTGTGLSHYTTYGAVAPIPVPAAVWLMVSGLAGLGSAGRRKKKAA